MSDDFKLITYKRKNRSSGRKADNVNNSPAAALRIDRDLQIKRIEEAKSEVICSDLFDSVLASLREGLATLKNPAIGEIVCFGLGRIGECTISRYQFAFLLCLKDLFKTTINVYDPVFSEDDCWLLERFRCKILSENIEGKYKVKDKCTTLFYLPHCPKQLSNNLLWANWGLELNYCIIIANSFNTIIENTSKRMLGRSAQFIQNICPYVLELAVINTFKFYEIFNDTAIHIFPWNNLKLLTEDFWCLYSEPTYTEDDTDMASKISTLRQIIHELRCVSPSEKSLRTNLAYEYILKQYRKYKTTDQQLCKAREEMEFMVSTYLCYLRSGRLQQEINKEFHGKGERSVEDTAKLVGFKLPNEPK